jgi:anti-anti-sigma factor
MLCSGLAVPAGGGSVVIRRVIQPREQAARGVRLRMSAVRDGGPPVLELEGEFDLDTVPEIDRFLRRTLGPLYHQDHLVIDLERTTFVDSSFIGFLVRLSAAQRAKRRELLLVRPVGQVRKVLAVVGLPNIVPVFESIEAAVQSLVGGRLPVIPPAFHAVAG